MPRVTLDGSLYTPAPLLYREDNEVRFAGSATPLTLYVSAVCACAKTLSSRALWWGLWRHYNSCIVNDADDLAAAIASLHSSC